MTKEDIIQTITNDPHAYLKPILIYRRDEQFESAVSYIQNKMGCDNETAHQVALFYFEKKPSTQYKSIEVICPYCQSTNTKKISGTSRFMSTGIFGLASGKIGKQWHCNSCKSDF